MVHPKIKTPQSAVERNRILTLRGSSQQILEKLLLGSIFRTGQRMGRNMKVGAFWTKAKCNLARLVRFIPQPLSAPCDTDCAWGSGGGEVEEKS